MLTLSPAYIVSPLCTVPKPLFHKTLIFHLQGAFDLCAIAVRVATFQSNRTTPPIKPKWCHQPGDDDAWTYCVLKGCVTVAHCLSQRKWWVPYKYIRAWTGRYVSQHDLQVWPLVKWEEFAVFSDVAHRSWPNSVCEVAGINEDSHWLPGRQMIFNRRWSLGEVWELLSILFQCKTV